MDLTEMEQQLQTRPRGSPGPCPWPGNSGGLQFTTPYPV